MRIGILGGGISGLALQKRLNHDSLILEAENRPGGLCRSFVKEGFGYDIGGHILFSKHGHVNAWVDELLGDNIFKQTRNNQIYYKGRYVKYPFENDLASLPLEDRYECLIGYLRAQPGNPTNLEEWAYCNFGKGISDLYFLPYNRKIWNRDPKEISLEWVSRIPKPPLEDVVKSALGISTEGYTHQLYFRYPLHGGFEALVHTLVQPDKVRCNSPVSQIRKLGESWQVEANGETHEFDQLVLSFPIHLALQCFDNVPQEVKDAVHGLRYNSIRICLIGVNNESLTGMSAVYVPDVDVLPNRLCFMGYFSPNQVPPGTSSVMCEITTTPGDEVDTMPDDEFVTRVVDDLDRIGILKKDDVIVTETRRFEFAYPVYDHGYTERIRVFHDYFKSIGVTLLGRFAEFDYINSDECLHRAMKLADELNAQS